MNENLQGAIRIAVVGPENSGRKWFVSSFPRSLQKYSHDENFEYHLSDVYDKVDLRPLPPTLLGMDQPLGDSVWEFKRSAKLAKKGSAFAVSSHTHIVNIIAPSIEDVSKITYPIGVENFLFLILDPTQLTDGSDEIFLTGVEKNGNLTKRKYTEYVRQILEEFTLSTNNSEWNLAVCITKGDLLNTSLQDIVSSVFGESMLLTIKQYKQRLKLIETFRTSAFGYIDDGGGKIPNTDPLFYDDVWCPSVEQPFFWAFEAVEKKRLHSLKNDFWGSLFKDTRVNSYIPYSIKSDCLS